MDGNKGQNLKGYELRDRLGAGGFGAVYKAYQSTVGREVAIKIILPGLANQPEFIRRFEGEAQLVARLEHPHITPLYDYWRDPDGAYLVMRWLRGGSLRDALQNGPYALPAACTLLEQVAGALSLAHRSGVIHRDIKPGNILLDEDGNAYLTDFGIAKDLNVPSSNTQQDAIIGSLDYISPEQARSEPVTPRTDIYSLGVTLYEVITGEHPFGNISSVERLFKHINDPLPEITILDTKVSEAVNRVIQKATAKNPEGRYPDALAFAADFREAIGLNRTSTTAVELLTQREHEILKLIIDGLSNKEIAQKLTVTLSTVKWYVNQIYSKLGVRSRVQAIVRAREMNLIVKAGQEMPLISLAPTDDFHPENPYKGLRAFQSGDNQDFFGREKVTSRLVKRLGDAGESGRFVAVVGPSGSGKSSLVKAGLIPALWRGELPGSEKWFVVEMLPGSYPLDELEIALSKVAANQAGGLREHLIRDPRGLVRASQLILPNAEDTELVLVIDQFEEVFTLVEDEEARGHFLDLLVAAVQEPRSRVRVVITLRADFYDRPLHYPAFGELVRTRLETIMPLSAEELERAITRPAERVGVRFEPGLVAAIIGDVNYQPGALPLLQYALTELFEQRKGRMLTREGYQAIGGTVGALARRAEELYLSLNNESQGMARQLFLRLVTLGEGTEDTRRRAQRSELLAIAEDGEVMEEIIDLYAEYRLFALDTDPGTRSPTVEVAHEALLREWERLRAWLNESREDIRQERLLYTAAADWEANGRDASYLLSGTRLEQAETWVNSTGMALTERERTFVLTSVNARVQQAEAERERKAREVQLEQRSQTFLRGLVAVLLVASLISAGLAYFAFGERGRAENARAISDANANLAATQAALAEQRADEVQSLSLVDAAQQAIEIGDIDLALSLSLEANRMTNPPQEAVRSLSEIAAIDTPTVIGIYEGLATPNTSFIVTPDERYVLFYDRVFPAPAEGASLHVLDLRTGEVVRSLEGLSNAIYNVSISPDSRSVTAFTSASDPNESSLAYWTAITWNLEDGQILRSYDGSETQGTTASIIYRPDGQTALAYQANVKFSSSSIVYHKTELQLINLATDEVLQSYDSGEGTFIQHYALSPDGNTLMVVMLNDSDPNAVTNSRMFYFWNLETGEELHFPEFQDQIGRYRFVNSLSFSPNGKRIVISGIPENSDNVIEVWDFERGNLIQGFSGRLMNQIQVQANRLPIDAQFTSDDLVIIYGGEKMILWDLSIDKIIYHFGRSYFPSAILSPNNIAVTAQDNGTVVVWDTRRQQIIGEEMRLEAHSGRAFTAVYSPDGRYILSAGDRGESVSEVLSPYDLVLWNAETGVEIRRMRGHSDWVNRVEFTPDSRFAVSASDDKLMFLWNVETGEVVRRFENVAESVNRMAISPDGHMILSSGCLVDECEEGHGDLRLWNIDTAEELQHFAGLEVSIGAAFGPGGNQVFGGGTDRVLVWDRLSGQMVHQFDLIGTAFDIAVSSNGFYALVGTQFGNVSGGVYLINLQNETVSFLSGNDSAVWGVAFSPNGDIAAAGDVNGVITLWDVASATQIQQFQAHSDSIGDISFSPDGRKLISASFDGSVRVWDKIESSTPVPRYLPELTCQQRELYRLELLCEAASQ